MNITYETKAELITRLEEFSSGSHALDLDFAEQLGICPHRKTSYYCIEDGNGYDSGHTCDDCGVDTYGKGVPALTTSIDAAFALLRARLPTEPPVYVGLQENRWSDKASAEALRWTCYLEWTEEDGENIEINSTAHTAPLAICIALLRFTQ